MVRTKQEHVDDLTMRLEVCILCIASNTTQPDSRGLIHFDCGLKLQPVLHLQHKDKLVGSGFIDYGPQVPFQGRVIVQPTTIQVNFIPLSLPSTANNNKLLSLSIVNILFIHSICSMTMFLIGSIMAGVVTTITEVAIIISSNIVTSTKAVEVVAIKDMAL